VERSGSTEYGEAWAWGQNGLAALGSDAPGSSGARPQTSTASPKNERRAIVCPVRARLKMLDAMDSFRSVSYM
jgi:hypothetical protein